MVVVLKFVIIFPFFLFTHMYIYILVHTYMYILVYTHMHLHVCTNRMNLSSTFRIFLSSWIVLVVISASYGEGCRYILIL